MEAGGSVLWLIAILVFFMWAMIFERIWYFSHGHEYYVSDLASKWNNRTDKTSWHALQIREKMLSQAKVAINQNLTIIQTCVVLAPLFGLLGTVTGMIEVFQIMAFTGGGDARSMAGGVSKATLHRTMANQLALPRPATRSTCRTKANKLLRGAGELELMLSLTFCWEEPSRGSWWCAISQ